jgi:hypothetical protein
VQNSWSEGERRGGGVEEERAEKPEREDEDVC